MHLKGCHCGCSALPWRSPPLRRRPVKHNCAGGKETRGVQNRKCPLNIPARTLSFYFLYKNALMDNNVPRLLMSQTS